MTDGGVETDRDELLAAVHDHLAACLERPVERTASRWIGEAEAVAGDLARSEVADAVVTERLGHVERLLAEVEDTGDERASEHVTEARALVDQLLSRLE